MDNILKTHHFLLLPYSISNMLDGLEEYAVPLFFFKLHCDPVPVKSTYSIPLFNDSLTQLMNEYSISAPTSPHSLRVGIIGGGIAGSTMALQLAELGIHVELFEAGTSLVNGPPICHLHAGGNLYREISDEQCITLLKQSIDTVKVFPHTVNVRPTVIAVPQHDSSDPAALLPRLNTLQAIYQQLVKEDATNEVLGDPQHYFKLYEQEDMARLAQCATPDVPTTLDDWMIPVAKQLNLDSFKFPLVLVQEFGWSVFRLSATAQLALSRMPNCAVHTHSKVTHLQQNTEQTWTIEYQTQPSPEAEHHTHTTQVDYLINACGFQTGTIDDLAKLSRERLVEFKAAYVTHWAECDGIWPEVIFHGERGTPDGMAQLTPYPNGYFQLHGMTEDITLFKQGLVSSTAQSAQPQLQDTFIRKIQQGWPNDEATLRSERAITHMSRFVPHYASATVGGKPLFGAQQIPGGDASLRAADISFDGQRYARTEIVKASSALSAAHSVVDKLIEEGLFTYHDSEQMQALTLPITRSVSANDVEAKAITLAEERQYPMALAQPFSYPIAS
ncbi:hypothetical protein JCM19237_5600 [Photobacterium aphoticum]|uniref:FAD dependent oxidoreductase domain-containing protein n=1 Tax=Photobacterium aphoticum TaxID=754436 RepID=A0A090R4X4_9GAMM|nr:hypothetical protein JCM19237_5600 [Photobacterium aphoticum]